MFDKNITLVEPILCKKHTLKGTIFFKKDTQAIINSPSVSGVWGSHLPYIYIYIYASFVWKCHPQGICTHVHWGHKENRLHWSAFMVSHVCIIPSTVPSKFHVLNWLLYLLFVTTSIVHCITPSTVPSKFHVSNWLIYLLFVTTSIFHCITPSTVSSKFHVLNCLLYLIVSLLSMLMDLSLSCLCYTGILIKIRCDQIKCGMELCWQ